MSRHLSPTTPGKRGFAWSMRALGKANLPERLRVGEDTYHLAQTVKHDFWAVTGFYRTTNGRRAVLKMSRTEPFAGIPLAFIGRWLCRRELRFYRRLADLVNIPQVLGTIADHGFLHDYVEGRPLARDKTVPDTFFADLHELIAQLHRRNIAYVDANKPENILLGDDGRPHLIDFQISWDLHELGDNPLNRWWLRRLQAADIYHILKHKKRMKPDQMTGEEWQIVTRRSPLIRLHRFIMKPYFKIRRGTFRRLRASGRLLPEGSK